MRHSKGTAILIAIIISLVSIGLLFANAQWIPDGATHETINNVLNTVLALGLIGFVYEVALRDEVFKETVETIGLKADVAKSSLSAIDRATSIDYPDLLEQADSVTVIVANPVGWMERDWNHLLSAAKERPIAIRLYLPKHDTLVAGEIAARLGYDPASFVEQAKVLRTYLESAWKASRQSVAAPVKGCTFKLALYDFVPAYEIAATQAKVCMLVPEVGSQAPGGDRLRLSFTRRRGPFPADWLISHLAELESLAPDYADEVK